MTRSEETEKTSAWCWRFAMGPWSTPAERRCEHQDGAARLRPKI